MKEFIDTGRWPLVGLHMPEEVPDERTQELIGQLESLYAQAKPFVLLMQGAELPKRSKRFMAAYSQWSRESFSKQQRYCLGAVRVEQNKALRRDYTQKAESWNASGHAPYPYRIVATHAAAEAQAHAWLDEYANFGAEAAAAAAAVERL